MKNTRSSILALLACTAFSLLGAGALHAQSPGGLTPPPGPIGPNMKSLALDPTQFPPAGYVIAQPGSYYLTGNVTGIDASDVTLDLRGFAIIAASGSSGTSTADSAILIGSGQSNVTVRNGSIVGTWYAGLYGISANCSARRLRVSRTNTYGIRLAADGA